MCSASLTRLLHRVEDIRPAAPLQLVHHPSRLDMSPKQNDPTKPIGALPQLIFASRWLQLPLYLGLILAQAVYVFHFWVELVHLVEAAFGDKTALDMPMLLISMSSAVLSPKAACTRWTSSTQKWKT